MLKPDGGGADDRGQIGVNRVAYTYAGAADLLATYRRLKAAGIDPYWPVHHGTTLSLYHATRTATASSSRSTPAARRRG